MSLTGFHNAFFDMSDPLGVTERQPAGCPPGAFPSDTLAGDPGNQPQGNSNCQTPRFRPGTLGPDRAGGGGQAAQGNQDQRSARAIEVRTLGASYGLELYLKRKLTSRVGGFVCDVTEDRREGRHVAAARCSGRSGRLDGRGDVAAHPVGHLLRRQARHA